MNNKINYRKTDKRNDNKKHRKNDNIHDRKKSKRTPNLPTTSFPNQNFYYMSNKFLARQTSEYDDHFFNREKYPKQDSAHHKAIEMPTMNARPNREGNYYVEANSEYRNNILSSPTEAEVMVDISGMTGEHGALRYPHHRPTLQAHLSLELEWDEKDNRESYTDRGSPLDTVGMLWK